MLMHFLLLFVLLVAVCCGESGVVDHTDHGIIHLSQGRVDVRKHPQFFEESHPAIAFKNMTLEERLEHSQKHIFFVHFSSKESLHQSSHHLKNHPEVHVRAYIFV
jgi:hypothetical protein